MDQNPGGPGTDAKPATNGKAVSLLLLSCFTFSGTLGMHVFVPALPLAALELHSSPGSMQLAVSLYVLGLAIGQLVYGPISDRLGRRPALFGGLILFSVASLFAAFATAVPALLRPGCCRHSAARRGSS